MRAGVDGVDVEILIDNDELEGPVAITLDLNSTVKKMYFSDGENNQHVQEHQL